MGKPVSLYDAKTHLPELVERAAGGEEIVITKAGKPKARLVPLRAPSVPRRPGAWRGRVRIAKDFDARRNYVDSVVTRAKALESA